MRIVFAGGGTGGHLYPGLAIARALVRANPAVRPFFVGAERGIERTVLPGTEFPYLLLDLHPLYRATFWNNWKTVVGGVSAWRRIGALAREERPALVVGTGGYAAGVMMAYAVTHGIPIVQQAADSHPGLTARAFSRYSREMYLNFPEAARFLRPHSPGSLVITGAPIAEPPTPRPDRAAAREKWGIPATGGHVVLIAGGSQGSLAINRAVAGWVEGGVPPDVHVIWATGRGTYDQFRALDRDRVHVRDYLAPIADAYAAADLVVGRAGAIATAEQMAWGLPSVLVPLPTAAADHQTTNARTLEAAGTAVHLPQAELSPERFGATISGLLANPGELARLRAGAAARARPHAADDIARRILALVGASATS
jgi:UDP-N-acetylglucosamine--N-acetylmuramyl-(pentapeptide) pyrophosphoryl-undecaprenol N-acetylglucosamine transferase